MRSAHTLPLLFFFFQAVVGAGNFSAQAQPYSVQTDSVAYFSVSGTGLPVTGSQEVSIPIGFDFTVDSTAFDSVAVRSNGLVIFNSLFKKIGFSGIYGLEPGPSFTLSYNLSGNPGSQSLVLQFSGLQVPGSGCPDSINYQIILSEAFQTMTFHQGAYTAYACNPSDTNITYKPIIGFVGLLGDGTEMILEGPESAPQLISAAAATTIHLNRMPAIGRRYTFIPGNN